MIISVSYHVTRPYYFMELRESSDSYLNHPIPTWIIRFLPESSDSYLNHPIPTRIIRLLPESSDRRWLLNILIMKHAKCRSNIYCVSIERKH